MLPEKSMSATLFTESTPVVRRLPKARAGVVDGWID